MSDIVWAFVRGSKNTIYPVVAGIVGFLIGLVLFGWWLTPVAYFDAGPQDLREADHQQFYLRSLANAYNADGNAAFVQAAFSQWPEGPVAICNAALKAETGSATISVDPTAAQRLRNMALIFDPNGCDSILSTAAAGGAAGAGISWTYTCGLGLLLLVLFGLFFVLWQRRLAGPDDEEFYTAPARPSAGMAAAQPTGQYEDGGGSEHVTPIASYRTSFTHGNDVYDDSFTIENVNGDFLGECGVDIAESIGTMSPKNVTAIEIWLFDKNDIRTITKVAMSDHAFFDDAIKAKLAPKGEPVLARPDEIVVLETASLIINARITELEYGDDPDLPQQSYFDRFAVELSAWAKDSVGTTAAASFEEDDLY